MPIFVRSDVNSGPGFFWIRAPFDPYLLTSTGAEISTDNNALVGDDSNHLVTILGRVEGALSGIVLGNDVNLDRNETVRVGASGYVYGEVDGIHIDARDSNVRNEGTVVGRQTGVELNASTGTTRLVNSGTILSDSEGIRSTGAQTLIIENTGLIYGLSRAIATFGGATAIITNTGEIVGEIYLDSGNDVYNGVNGRISGPITCFGGNDTVYAGVDDDIISGMGGNDVLDGGLGADRMDGGANNDTFYVDNVGDIVVEAAGDGFDRVLTSISYTLGAAAEVEVFTTTDAAGTAPLNLTGNAFVQSIGGNAGANILNGGGGADTMSGYGGNDDYFVDNAGDVIASEGVSSGEMDRVFASVSYVLAAGQAIERLSTTSQGGTGTIHLTGSNTGQLIVGNNGTNFLFGLGGADTLNGNGGNDRLFGGEGNDILNGGAGLDKFIFDTAPNSTLNRDTIQNYVVADDEIWVDDAFFTALTPGWLAASAFHTGAAAADPLDRIIYDPATGALIYDANGSNPGGAIQFATLSAGLAMTNAEFNVI